MRKRIWWVAMAGSGIGVLYLLSALFGGDFAPQQTTAKATMAIAFAVVSYCFAQAFRRLFPDQS